MSGGATSVLRELQRHPEIQRLEQIPRLRALRQLPDQLVTDAIAELVELGALQDDPWGRLVVQGRHPV